MAYPPNFPYGPPSISARPEQPKPAWVQIGLLGIGSRRQAMAWLVGTLTASIVAIVGVFLGLYLGLELPLVLAALAALVAHVALSFAALWYWLCIRWMDRNGGW